MFEDEFLPQIDALYNFAYNLTFNENDSNDLIQETFLGWLPRRHEIELEKWQHYLFRVAYSKLVDALRHQYRRDGLTTGFCPACTR